MNHPNPRRAHLLLKFVLIGTIASFFPSALLAGGLAIHFVGDSDTGEGGRWTRAIVQEWARKTGNNVDYISRPNDSTLSLQLYQQYWAAKSSEVDVYMIDGIWPGIAAPHAVDLKKYFTEDEIKEHFPRIIEKDTVDGKLVGMPFFTDIGLLFYRTDLLKKYGYREPPQTWEELTEMAKKIQDGERQVGYADFWGFVFEGKASESVTCNAIEWIYSYGGGIIIDPNKKVTINNPSAVKALDIAKAWVGSIAPRGVVTYGEEEARILWQNGNAAFMRNWPYAYALSADPKSPISGKFAVTGLPKGGKDGKNPACLGGWEMMVSAYSKHPDVAADLVRYLCSAYAQKKRAIDLSQLPTRPALYSDPDLLAKNAWFSYAAEILTNALARPSTVAKGDYNQLSTGFFQNVNEVLSGSESAQEAVSNVERIAKRSLP